MALTIKELLSALDSCHDRIPLDRLLDLIQEISVVREELEPFLRFDEGTYQRNLMHQGLAYQVLLICWLNGQRSPIHDHRDTSCATRIMEGTALETRYEKAENGMIYPTRSIERREGTVFGSQDEDIHQISNLQGGGKALITLHIHSPPVTRANIFSLDETGVCDFCKMLDMQMIHRGALGKGG